MMKRYLMLTLMTTVALTAQAEESAFTALDVDQDGKISVQEAKANQALAKLFKQLDKDQDGFLSKAEMIGTQELAKKAKH